MTSFFDRQDNARRTSRVLLVMFAGAIALTIALFYIACLIYQNPPSTFWQPKLLLFITVLVTTFVGIGSGRKMRSLRKQGGISVMKSLGAQPIATDQHPKDLPSPEIQRLNNVVAEMAIASGAAIPNLYRLPSSSINALVVGFSENEAVLGVTEGAISQLTREELQGLIAYEFSHIINGDMALNLEIMGLVHGLLAFTLIGRKLISKAIAKMQQTLQLRQWLDLNINLKHPSQIRVVVLVLGILFAVVIAIGILAAALGNGILQTIGTIVLVTGFVCIILLIVSIALMPIAAINFFILAIMLYVAGGMGWLSAQIIKSAVLQQRVQLADAVAVQFTRNPMGLINVLQRTTQPSSNVISQMPPVAVAEASHLFCCPAVQHTPLIPLFSTHIPTSHRINYLKTLTPKPAHLPSHATATALPTQAAPQHALTRASVNLTETIGQPSLAHIHKAQSLLTALPAYLLTAAQSQAGAVAIIYTLLLSDEASVRLQQKQIIAESAESVCTLLDKIEPLITQLPVKAQLPLLELCIPRLKTLKPVVAAQLFKRVKTLVRMDSRLSLREYALQTILQYRLAPHFRTEASSKTVYRNLAELQHECIVVISALAHAGHNLQEQIDHAFYSGLSKLFTNQSQQLSPSSAISLNDVGKALKKLRQTDPKLKKKIAEAFVHTVLLDNKTTDSEAELLRAILITLGCPVPPFLNSHLPAVNSQ